MSGTSDDVTALLQAWAGGQAGAGDRLFDRVYSRLHRLAANRLSREDAPGELRTGDVMHEAYLRLAGQKRVTWRNRAHFFAVAARLIRRVLLDQVKFRRRRKRGDGTAHVPLEHAEPAGIEPDLDLVALGEALDDLAAVDPMAVRVVRLRYLAGLNLEETAEVLGVGRATVVRSWRFARAWLARRLAA